MVLLSTEEPVLPDAHSRQASGDQDTQHPNDGAQCRDAEQDRPCCSLFGPEVRVRVQEFRSLGV